MSHLLVTFCNAFPLRLALAEMDFSTGAVRWIDVDRAGQPVNALTGICRHGDRYWVLHQHHIPPWLTELDESFRPVRHFVLQSIADPHSLIPHEDGFLVADTGNNRVSHIRLGANGEFEESVFWQYCEPGSDLVHLNSVARWRENLYVSMFGPKPEQGWWEADQGKIIDITQSRVICDGLRHPHTLMPGDDGLYWLESRRGRLHRYTADGEHKVIAELTGYVRGMAFEGSHVYVAASALRRRSRSTGEANNHSKANSSDWHSWLYRIDLRTGQRQRCDMTPYGNEIYDLAILERPIWQPECLPDCESAVARIWKFEDECSMLREVLESRQQALQQYQEQSRQYQQQQELAQQQIGDLQRQAAGLQAAMASLSGRNADLEAQLAAMIAENAYIAGQKSNLETYLAAIEGTRTWRLRNKMLSAVSHLHLRKAG